MNRCLGITIYCLFSAVLVYNVIGVVAAGEQVCYRILVDVCSALHTIAAI